MVTAPDGRPGCSYCEERLRVNVGLLTENKQLRARVGVGVPEQPAELIKLREDHRARGLALEVEQEAYERVKARLDQIRDYVEAAKHTSQPGLYLGLIERVLNENGDETNG